MPRARANASAGAVPDRNRKKRGAPEVLEARPPLTNDGPPNPPTLVLLAPYPRTTPPSDESHVARVLRRRGNLGRLQRQRDGHRRLERWRTKIGRSWNDWRAWLPCRTRSYPKPPIGPPGGRASRFAHCGPRHRRPPNLYNRTDHARATRSACARSGLRSWRSECRWTKATAAADPPRVQQHRARLAGN